MASPSSAIAWNFTAVAPIATRHNVSFFCSSLKMYINNKQEGSADVYAEPRTV
jgi:hypothetical protein